MPSPLFARKPISLLLEEMHGEHRLRRVLGPLSLTSLGVGCVIGAGIFVYAGVAAHDRAGPSVILSFGVAGVACILAALCYAEFAAMVPVAGSAYTYAYATLGELFAWIIGWDLILEYAVGAASVANGWSKYFQNLLAIFHVHMPKLIATAPLDFDPDAGRIVATGAAVDLLAVIIIAIITTVLVIGIRESAGVNNAMVIVKVGIVLMVIAVGAFYVRPSNWHPFAPYGYTGVNLFGRPILGQVGPGNIPLGMLAGAAMIFFAYIGFDSVSTHAEEARNPQRDVPIGIIASLLICTVLYVVVAAVLTGMVPYQQLSVDAPVANAFQHVGLVWAQLVISIGAVIGITSVLLVLMLSQPRVWLAMARDGLVPPGFFGAVHPRFRTPWKATILTGIAVGALSGLVPLRILAELVSIGTLLAFVIVCVGVLVMRSIDPGAHRPFRAPLVPFVPAAGALLCLVLMLSLPPHNWLRLFIWLVIGFVVYFGYGRKNSVMARMRAGETVTPIERVDESCPMEPRT
jgi:APA family basic amino acid/polyamine antiporter